MTFLPSSMNKDFFLTLLILLGIHMYTKMVYPLTSKQKEILDFIKSYFREKGFPPTLREIASHFGLKSPRSSQKGLQILERKGFIQRVPHRSRGIELLSVPKSPLREVISVPLVGKVRAGEPVLALENVEGYLYLDRSLISSDDVFLLRVEGDSMVEAHIQEGDFALVRPQSHAENGEIVVVLVEDEATIKRIFTTRDFIRLEPANPRFPPMLIKKGERKVTIVGKVIGIFRKL